MIKAPVERALIAVPVIGRDAAEIQDQLVQIHASTADLIEWRIDYLDALTLEQVQQLLPLFKKPVLLTWRTEQEGGVAPFDPSRYQAIYQWSALQSNVVALDVELALLPAVEPWLPTLVGVKLVGSCHLWTPTVDASVQWQALLASPFDVLKLALMPADMASVTRLLSQTQTISQQDPRPLISLAMGPLGVVTRLEGWHYGSAVTFACLPGKASAPGQVTIDELKS